MRIRMFSLRKLRPCRRWFSKRSLAGLSLDENRYLHMTHGLLFLTFALSCTTHAFGSESTLPHPHPSAPFLSNGASKISGEDKEIVKGGVKPRESGPLHTRSLRLEALDDAVWLDKEAIGSVIEQLLRLHVDHHKITATMLQEACLHYFQGFDPQRVYLLESEVSALMGRQRPFWDRQVDKIMQGDIELFEEARRIIVKAIWRCRRFQKSLMSELGPRTPRAADNVRDQGIQSTERDELDPYRWPVTLRELQSRFNQFSHRERVRADSLGIEDQFLYHLREHEDDYLLVDDLGESMPPKVAEHTKVALVLKALISSFDPHSALMGPGQLEDMKKALAKGYVGCGLWIEKVGGDAGTASRSVKSTLLPRSRASKASLLTTGFFVREVMHKSPAEIAGLKVGDQILEIEGIGAHNLSMDAIEQLFSKRPAPVALKSLTLKIARGQAPKQIYTFHVQPTQQEENSSSLGVDVEVRELNRHRFARFAFNSFYENESGSGVADELEHALAELMQEGRVDGLILDLRDNGGGFLSQAVKVAGLFLKTGVVAVVKYGDNAIQYWRDTDSKDLFDGPMVVLVSARSASATEIVAQALQDYGAAIVAGDLQTYGKGTVQFHNLFDSEAHSHYKITVGRYYTVSGRSTQIEGVKSDIVLPSSPKNLWIGERYARGALPGDKIAPLYDDRLSDYGNECDSARGLQICAKERLWLLKNYIPFLEKHSLRWLPLLPKLRSESHRRVNLFLSQFQGEQPSSMISSSRSKKSQEALEVLSDEANRSLPGEEVDVPSFDEQLSQKIDRFCADEAFNLLEDMTRLELFEPHP